MAGIRRFAIETAIYGFANVFSRAFAMLLIPLYTNYLNKTEYSNLNMLQSVFTVMSFLLALNSGVFYYYYEYENVKYKKIVFASWFYYQFVISCVLTLAVCVSLPVMERLFIVTPGNQTEIRLGLVLICLQFLPFMVNNTNINYFRIDRRPKYVLYIVFAEALLSFLIILALFQVRAPSITLVLLAQVIARSIVAVASSRTTLFYARVGYFSKKILKKILLLSWPFFIISGFGWAVISLDKFIGVQALQNKSDIALLSLATQLVVPLAVLAGMINQAIGPFIMSIRKEKHAAQTFQSVFDFSIFAASLLAAAIICFSPGLTLILANESYLGVMYVLPLMAIASVIGLLFNQLCPAFSLAKKNHYIALASVLGSVVGVVCNLWLMPRFGYLVSGISQVFSYVVMAIVLFSIGKHKNIISIRIEKSLLLLLLLAVYIGLFYAGIYSSETLSSITWISVVSGAGFLLLFCLAFFRIQNIEVRTLLQMVKQKGRA